LDLFDTKDSILCAIASNPAEDFIILEADFTKSGIRKKKSGFIELPSIEYFFWLM